MHKKKLNLNHIEKLYEDYNDKLKSEKTSKKTFFDEVVGVTFKPFQMSKEKNKNKFRNVYDISNSRKEFLERNNNLLNSKKNFSEIKYKLLNENFNPTQSYGVYEKERIRTDVLKRLYFNETDKIKSRRNLQSSDDNFHKYEDEKNNFRNINKNYNSISNLSFKLSPVARTNLNFKDYLRYEFYENKGASKRFNFNLKEKNYSNKNREKINQHGQSIEEKITIFNKKNKEKIRNLIGQYELNTSQNRKNIIHIEDQNKFSLNEENTNSYYSEEQLNSNHIFTFKTDITDLLKNKNDEKEKAKKKNYFNHKNNNYMLHKSNSLNLNHLYNENQEKIFKDCDGNKNNKINKNSLYTRSLEDKNSKEKNNSKESLILKNKQLMKSNLKNFRSFKQGGYPASSYSYNSTLINQNSYNENKNSNNELKEISNIKETHFNENQLLQINDDLKKSQNQVNNISTIGNIINISQNGISKTLQNYNSQYLLNTDEEYNNNNYSNNFYSNIENNLHITTDPKNSENVNMEKKKYSEKEKNNKASNHKKDLNLISSQSDFNSPKNILLSTKSTNNNYNNLYQINKIPEEVINKNNDNFMIAESNADLINQFNNKNNMIYFYNVFKKNPQVNTIQETLSLDNEIDNFQNYTNINSDIEPYNTQSSKSNFLFIITILLINNI